MSIDKIMTLDEAIKHLDETIANMECSKCKEEHIQLRNWLKELKLRREMETIPR